MKYFSLVRLFYYQKQKLFLLSQCSSSNQIIFLEEIGAEWTDITENLFYVVGYLFDTLI